MASYTQCNELNIRLQRARSTYPDRRTKEYKAAVTDAYHETIDDLMRGITSRDHSKRKLRAQLISTELQSTSDVPPTCCICTEVMDGRVFLKCGHEICPDCFARHSRLSNTCPFCRDVFSSKPKKQVKLPLYQLDFIADSWADSVQHQDGGYFKQQTLNLLHRDNPDELLKFLIRENAKILMRKVKNWYDADIEAF